MAVIHPLRLNPPNGDGSTSSVYSLHSLAQRMNMEQLPFVVRVLPSQGLEGAFRVHLSPESLEKLELRVGDLCQITGEEGGIGYGLAWRATDKMGNSPKLRPAKMTDTLRSAFSFKEGSHVTIQKTTTQIIHAEKITISDVTPTEYGQEHDDKRWKKRTDATLIQCEALAAGITFDVTATKARRKRFFIDHIEPSAPGASGAALYYCDDETQLVFSDGSSPTESALPNGDAFPVLDTSRIGGLVEQVKELNLHLDDILQRARATAAPGMQAPHRHVLLHGYEGTGKSLLLERMGQMNACKVYRIKKGTTTAKTEVNISTAFDHAVASQPSVVLIDDAEKIASSENETLVDVLREKLGEIRGKAILVVAATRLASAIDSRLRRAGRFSKQIELPIPDVEARRQILNVLFGYAADAEDALTTAVSYKSHGFTGSDLEQLVEEAAAHAKKRLQEQEAWVEINARASMLNMTNGDGQVDGEVGSQATTEVGRATPSRPNTAHGDAMFGPLVPDLVDFEYAIANMKPTALREVFLEKPKVRWSDIGGADAVKTRLDNSIGMSLTHAELMAEWHISPTKGVLLYGPPGCSKTMTAQAVATMYDLNFIAVKGAELISMYVGESERAVRELFRKAKQAAPCVIFFDEIDSIGGEREGGTKGLNVLTTLLNEMDGFETLKNVFVLAATNRPETLDPALLRPGRFDVHIYVGVPNPAARKEILQIGLKDLRLAANASNLDDWVSATKGYSGAEIIGICDVAKGVGMQRQLTDPSQPREVMRQDFEQALGQTQKGITGEMLQGYEAFATRGKQ